VKVATVSLNQVWEDKKANINLCENYIKVASDKATDIIIFPEMTLTGFSPCNILLAESIINSQTLKQFSNLAKKYNINIIFGAYLQEEVNNLFYNMLCIAHKDGSIHPVYSKTHLFSHSNEDKFISPGGRIVTRKLGDMVFGFAICYDLRFPELFSIMSGKCDVIVIIANWPSSRNHHCHVLLRARAIENECIVFGVNRTGVDGNKIKYSESSVMITPDGCVEKACFSFSDLNIYKIKKIQVEKYRKNLPTIKNKRFSLYKQYWD